MTSLAKGFTIMSDNVYSDAHNSGVASVCQVHAVWFKGPGSGEGSAVFYGVEGVVRRAVQMLWPETTIERFEPWDGEGGAHHAKDLIDALTIGRRYGCLSDHRVRVKGGKLASDQRNSRVTSPEVADGCSEEGRTNVVRDDGVAPAQVAQRTRADASGAVDPRGVGAHPAGVGGSGAARPHHVAPRFMASTDVGPDPALSPDWALVAEAWANVERYVRYAQSLARAGGAELGPALDARPAFVATMRRLSDVLDAAFTVTWAELPETGHPDSLVEELRRAQEVERLGAMSAATWPAEGSTSGCPTGDAGGAS